MKIKDKVKRKKHERVYQASSTRSQHMSDTDAFQTRVGQPRYGYLVVILFHLNTREQVEEHIRRSNAIFKSWPLSQKLYGCLIPEYLLFDDS